MSQPAKSFAVVLTAGIIGYAVAIPIKAVAYDRYYNGTHCAVELWEEGIGTLYSDSTLWNASSSDTGNYSCPTVAGSSWSYSEWDLYVYVHDAHPDLNVEARPFNCYPQFGNCSWKSTKGSAGDDVNDTLDWTNMSTSGGVFAGFWINLPVTDSGERSGLYGYLVDFHN